MNDTCIKREQPHDNEINFANEDSEHKQEFYQNSDTSLYHP